MSGISLQANIDSLSAQRHVNSSNRALSQALSRLSSGYRVNSAMDDAAGMAVSETMRAEVRGLYQAVRNANDGLSVVQTAEGAMGEISSALIRMRELTVQAASDSLTDSDRAAIDVEFQELSSEIDRVTASTKFNGQVLLAGAFALTGLDFQVGFENGASFRISVTIDDVSTGGLGFAGTEAVNTKANAQSAMGAVDSAIDALNTARAAMGAKGNRLTTAASAVSVMHENLSAAASRIRDADIAAETSTFSRMQVLMQAGVAMLAQANSRPQTALRLLGA